MANHELTSIIIKSDVGKYNVWTIDRWQVRSSALVEHDSGSTTCTCQMFRFESKCDHTAGVLATCSNEHFGAGDVRGIPHQNAMDALENNRVLILGGTGGPVIVSPTVGDLTAHDLVHAMAMTTPTEANTKKLDDPTSFLNPDRIALELLTAHNRNESVASAGVKEQGEKVPKLTAEDFPDSETSSYDESLTAKPDQDAKPLPPGKKQLWNTVKRPDPKSFYVDPVVWEQILFTMEQGGNVLLCGPSGSGKSELAYIAAKAMQLDIAAFNFGAMQEPRTALIGATHFDKDKGTWFAESRFVRAVKSQRHAILLDELTRDRGASAHNILLPLLDRQGYLSLDEHDDAPIVHKGSQVSFIATANIGAEYTGTEALDKALKDRMDIVIEMDWAPKQYEVKILMSRCAGLRAADAAKLVDLAIRQRELAVVDMEFTEQISTRMLIAAGTRVGQGMKLSSAIDFAIVNHFSSEGGDASERTKIRQIVQKNG